MLALLRAQAMEAQLSEARCRSYEPLGIRLPLPLHCHRGCERRNIRTEEIWETMKSPGRKGTPESAEMTRCCGNPQHHPTGVQKSGAANSPSTHPQLTQAQDKDKDVFLARLPFMSRAGVPSSQVRPGSVLLRDVTFVLLKNISLSAHLYQK